MGWTVPWYLSFGSDFNYDFQVTLNESVALLEYNYRTKAEHEKAVHPTTSRVSSPSICQG